MKSDFNNQQEIWKYLISGKIITQKGYNGIYRFKNGQMTYNNIPTSETFEEYEDFCQEYLTQEQIKMKYLKLKRELEDLNIHIDNLRLMCKHDKYIKIDATMKECLTCGETFE